MIHSNTVRTYTHRSYAGFGSGFYIFCVDALVGFLPYATALCVVDDYGNLVAV